MSHMASQHNEYQKASSSYNMPFRKERGNGSPTNMSMGGSSALVSELSHQPIYMTNDQMNKLPV
jgi:hypothetical protein